MLGFLKVHSSDDQSYEWQDIAVPFCSPDVIILAGLRRIKINLACQFSASHLEENQIVQFQNVLSN